MNWEQYSKRRRGMTLQDFLLGCDSKEEALNLFAIRNIEPPLDLLNALYDNKNVSHENEAPTDASQKKIIEVSDIVKDVGPTHKKTKVTSSGTTNN